MKFEEKVRSQVMPEPSKSFINFVLILQDTTEAFKGCVCVCVCVCVVLVVGEGEVMYSGLYCRLITLALLGRMDQRKARADA